MWQFIYESHEHIKLFRMIGYGDNIGSGFQKILAAWRSLGYKRPKLEELDDVNEVWLTLPLVESNEAVSTENSTVDDPLMTV